MKREIKFRAFDTENKEMLEVQELDYEDSWNGQPMVRTTMYNDYFDTEEMILMQYTGLKDKNGVEIYEGDIVQARYFEDSTSEKYVVKYDTDRAGFFPFACGDGCGCCETDVISVTYVEILGNIYDNPELIEKEGT